MNPQFPKEVACAPATDVRVPSADGLGVAIAAFVAFLVGVLIGLVLA